MTTLTNELVDALEAVYRNEGASALIDAASEAGTNNGQVSALWCAAMTATFGPVGLHKSWTNEDGSPSAEALERLPDVSRAVEQANERIPHIFAAMRREIENERAMVALFAVRT